LKRKLGIAQEHSSYVITQGTGKKGLLFQFSLVIPDLTNGDEKKPERTDMGTKAIAINGKGQTTVKRGDKKGINAEIKNETRKRIKQS